jgi:hypothetical protein
MVDRIYEEHGMKIDTIFYAVLKIPCLPVARFELGRDRIVLEDLAERGGVLILNFKGLFFILPNQRLRSKLNAIKFWEDSESPQVPKPHFKIEKQDLIPCPAELIQTLATEIS